MASVDFKKFKNVAHAKSAIRHCDKDERLKREHSNQDINKSDTHQNLQLKRSYDETVKRFDARLDYLDSLEGANKRKDRVTCFGLNIPIPEDLKASDIKSWTNKTLSIIKAQYGEDNLMGAYVHMDEVHEYFDATTGKKRISRPHMHAFVVPEVNGKLNGKQFSSRANMKKLNDAIHQMSMDAYSAHFMDGSQKKSRMGMGQLKSISNEIANEVEKRTQETVLEARRIKNKALEHETELNSREEQLNAFESRLNAQQDELTMQAYRNSAKEKELEEEALKLSEREKRVIKQETSRKEQLFSMMDATELKQRSKPSSHHLEM